MIWALNLTVDWRETDASQQYYHAAGKASVLANDFYSWEVERDEPSPEGSEGRKWNVIPIVMHQLNLPENEAKLLVQGMLIDAEQEVSRLGRRLAKTSEAWKDYVRAMEYFLGGSAFWSATCPRYNLQPV